MVRQTCHGKFNVNIPIILANGPLTTQEIYKQLMQIVSECISDEKCPHRGKRGNRSDYEWQHSVRRAQFSLKRKNIISNLGENWYVLPTDNFLNEVEEMEIENLYRNMDTERIREELKLISPKSPRYEIIQGMRFARDRATIAKLKILRGFKCQICGTRIVKKDGTFYAEGAHIKPKRGGFSETPDNILILCPNHHKEFDLSAREIIEHNSEFFRFIMSGREYRINLEL